MPVSKGEIAALNAVLKDLGVYTYFQKGTGCLEYKGCSFGFNNEGQVDIDNKGQVVNLQYNTSDPSLEEKDSFLSTEIGNLSNLINLSLRGYEDKGYLKGSIPTEIGNLKALRELQLDNNCLTIDQAGINAITSLNVYKTGNFNSNYNCIAKGALNGVTEPNCKHCGNCPTVLPSICTSNIDDILFPVLPDPEPKPKPKPKPKYRTVFNN